MVANGDARGRGYAADPQQFCSPLSGLGLGVVSSKKSTRPGCSGGIPWSRGLWSKSCRGVRESGTPPKTSG